MVIHVAMPTVLHDAWLYATRRFPTRPPNQARCAGMIGTDRLATPRRSRSGETVADISGVGSRVSLRVGSERLRGYQTTRQGIGEKGYTHCCRLRD